MNLSQIKKGKKYILRAQGGHHEGSRELHSTRAFSPFHTLQERGEKFYIWGPQKQCWVGSGVPSHLSAQLV